MRREGAAVLVSMALHVGVLALPGVGVRPPEPVEEEPAVALRLRPPPAPIVEEIAEPEGSAEIPEPPAPAPPPSRPAPRPPSLPEPPPPAPPEDVSPPEVPPPAVEEAVIEPPPVPVPKPAEEAPAEPIPRQPEPGDGPPADPGPTATPGDGRERTGTESGPGRNRRGKKRRAQAEVLPRPVFAPKPPYPARSRDLGEEGTVILSVLVGADGRVEECRIDRSSGHPLLDGSALATVRDKWRFRPGTIDGEPASRWVRLPVEFAIRGR